jgi:hypothetical protein
VPDTHANQHGALTAARAFKQLQRTARALDPYSFRQKRHGDAGRFNSGSLDNGRFRHFAILTRRQAHVTRGHDGGNGMLVDHLTDAVSEQDDELVKGIDLSLLFDAVHEINGDGHALLAQRIEKRILQRLATGHG